MNESLPVEDADIHSASDEYRARFSGAVGEWFLKVQTDIVLTALSNHPGATVLEVGGGHGQLALPLADAGFVVTVLGSDDSALTQVREAAASGRLKTAIGNLVALPFPDRSFDIVISFRLLPHCQQWEKLIAELCRVSRKMVVVDYPTSRSLNSLTPMLFGLKKSAEGNTRPYRLFTHGELEAAVRRAGFMVTQRSPQFFWPMVIHRLVKLAGFSKNIEALARALSLTRTYGSPVILSCTPSHL